MSYYIPQEKKSTMEESKQKDRSDLPNTLLDNKASPNLYWSVLKT